MKRLSWRNVVTFVMVIGVVIGLVVSQYTASKKMEQELKKFTHIPGAVEFLKQDPEAMRFLKENPDFADYISRNPEVTKLIIEDAYPHGRGLEIFREFIEKKTL